jgi:hypothetical protein
MRRADAVIALIEDPAVIERILSWLGLWHPRTRRNFLILCVSKHLIARANEIKDKAALVHFICPVAQRLT